MLELAVDANERAQAGRRARGNGGAVAVGPSATQPGAAEADTGPATA